MRRTLALATAWVAAAVRADDPSSQPPVAALPPAVSFAADVDSTGVQDAPATVAPSSALDEIPVDTIDTSTSSSTTTSGSSSAASSAAPSPFRLVLSASSNDAVDLLEITRTSVADAPRISFESMTNKSAWDVTKWENPLTLLSNMIANEHIHVDADNVRLAVELTDPAKATLVTFAKTNEWHYGPTLVLGDHALDGLSRIKQLEFSNFNVSFEGSKWLPTDTTLKKLVFNKSTVASFSFAKEYTILRAEFRDSVLSSFPTALLEQPTLAEALTIEDCTFSQPFKLSAENLATLQTLPSVKFAQNAFPEASVGECTQTVAYEGASICLTTPSEQGGGSDPLKPIEPSPSEPSANGPSVSGPSTAQLDNLPPTAPLSDARLSSSRGMLNTLISVLGIVGAIALVAGFVLVRRRKSTQHQHDDLSLSNRSDKFLEGADDEDVEGGIVRGMAYSQRTTTVGMGFLSDVDLGPAAIHGETRLGANGLWRADYRGETVAALRVNVEGLRERERDIEAVVASCVALRHPYLIEFLGTSMATSDEMWLVAEYMTKGSLRSVMFKKKLTFTWAKMRQVSLDLASALAFVQSARDSTTRVTPTLSSRSVLCDGELNCKLDVFEFAQPTRDQARLVFSYGQGEIAFRAPELLRSGNASDLTPTEAAAAEVFAFGVIMCEMSFQSPLYSEIYDQRGVTIGEIFIAHEVAAGRLRPAPAADVPDEYARIIDACVAYDPAERPTIEQVIDRLTSLTE